MDRQNVQFVQIPGKIFDIRKQNMLPSHSVGKQKIPQQKLRDLKTHKAASITKGIKQTALLSDLVKT